jgi:hypothetical protein
MKPLNIDLINIFLMIISFGCALVLPIETFLIAYAVLGPLHYLTEINWLNNKNFFLKTKKESTILILVGILTFLMMAFNFESLSLITYTLLWGLFLLPLYFVLGKKHESLFLLLMLGLISWSFFNDFLFNFITVFLFTIIHVYIFTGIFILIGSIKNKSKLGYLSLIFYIILPMSYFVFLKDIGVFLEKDLQSYKFAIGNTIEELSLLFLNKQLSIDNIYNSIELLMISKFVAFAYTYHYLNWFSKTKVIGWLENNKIKIFTILILWVLSVSIYFFDYILGFKILLFLSFLHVVLEFPLNWTSIKTLMK